MAFKRNTDRLPIIPADAKKHNVTCHYCIVGCGYNAYTWPVNKQGGTAPAENAFGVDLSKQQAAETDAWYAPSMRQTNRRSTFIVGSASSNGLSESCTPVYARKRNERRH